MGEKRGLTEFGVGCRSERDRRRRGGGGRETWLMRALWWWRLENESLPTDLVKGHHLLDPVVN